MAAIRSVGHFLNHHKLNVVTTAALIIPVALMAIGALSLAGVSPIAIIGSAAAIAMLGGGGTIGLACLTLLLLMLTGSKPVRRQQVQKNHLISAPAVPVQNQPTNGKKKFNQYRQKQKAVLLPKVEEMLNKLKQTKKIEVIEEYHDIARKMDTLQNNNYGYIIFELKNVLMHKKERSGYLIYTNNCWGNLKLAFVYEPSSNNLSLLIRPVKQNTLSIEKPLTGGETALLNSFLNYLNQPRARCYNVENDHSNVIV